MTTRPSALAILALVAATAPAPAQQIAVERLYDRGGYPAAVVSVVNDRKQPAYAQLQISCVFTRAGKIMGQGSRVVMNLAFGQRDATHIYDTNTRFDQVDGAECRIVTAD